LHFEFRMTVVLDTSPASISRAADCLRAGGLVAFPTETVYGLGVHALDPAAVRRAFVAKGRPAYDPLIVHLLSWEDVEDLLGDELLTGPYSRARRLAACFWPGPLTLVLPRGRHVPRDVTAGLDTVAIRVPAHPVARALLDAAAIPIAAPSANLFSRPSPTRAQHVMQDLDGRIDLVIDGGATSVGVESTVLDLTRDVPTILRPGAVTREMLAQYLPMVQEVSPVAPRSSERTAPPPEAMASPGMLPKHYSPRAPLTLYEGPHALERMVGVVRESVQSGQLVGVAVPREHAHRFHGLPLRVAELGAAGDLGAIAARLYAAFRELDASGVEAIFAVDVEGTGGLAVAVRDRLRRAAAGRIIHT
jgi:L-threonylcarbamoyladenylate synthase